MALRSKALHPSVDVRKTEGDHLDHHLEQQKQSGRFWKRELGSNPWTNKSKPEITHSLKEGLILSLNN